MSEHESNLPWVRRPTVEVDLGLPLRRRYERIDDAIVESGVRLLRGVIKEFPTGSAAMADLVRLRTGNRFGAELGAISRRVGVSWRHVMLANVSYDLALAFIGCSTVALATGEGPVLARNMDWWPEDLLARATYEFRCVEGGALRYATAGWPGAVGVVTGMSGRGFAVALNAALADDGADKLGYPVLLHLRRVLEDAAGFDDAVRSLSETRLVMSGLFTVVGTRNDQRVVIERAPRRAALRWAEGDRPLAATNHFRLLDAEGSAGGLPLLDDTSCGRYAAVTGFCGSLDPTAAIEDAALLYMLSEPTVIQGITAQHIVMRPATGRMGVYVPRRLLETLRVAGA